MRISLLLSISFLSLSINTLAQQSLNRISHSIDLIDSHIEYFTQGDTGDVIVLLPGGALNVDYMDGLANELVRSGYRVVSVNPRGAGNSTGKAEGVTLHDLANDVAAVIKKEGTGRVTVVGHAFGNRVARMLDTDHPELVDAVILLAAGGKVPGTPDAENALKVIFSPDATEAERQSAMKFMVGNPEDAKKAWDILRSSLAPGAGPIQYTASDNTPVNQWWAPSGKSRYLIIQGSLDQAAPERNGVILKEDLGDRAKIVSLEMAGHLMLITYPEKCSKEIVSFLKSAAN